MRQLCVWICDDDPVFLDFCAKLIGNVWHYPVRTFPTCESLLDALYGVKDLPDCVLLNLVFPRGHSLSTGAAIRRFCPSTRLIYITAHRKYPPEVFESDPVYFLEKPIDAHKLQAAFQAVDRSRILQSGIEILTIQKGRHYIRIPVCDIDYLESDRRKLLMYGAGEVIDWNETISEVAERLPDMFAQPHKSYLVNMENIFKLDGDEIVMFSGRRLPVAQKRSKGFRQAFVDFAAKTDIAAERQRKQQLPQGSRVSRRPSENQETCQRNIL